MCWLKSISRGGNIGPYALRLQVEGKQLQRMGGEEKTHRGNGYQRTMKGEVSLLWLRMVT